MSGNSIQNLKFVTAIYKNKKKGSYYEIPSVENIL